MKMPDKTNRLVFSFYLDKSKALEVWNLYKKIRTDWIVYLLPGVINGKKGWVLIYGPK